MRDDRDDPSTMGELLPFWQDVDDVTAPPESELGSLQRFCKSASIDFAGPLRTIMASKMPPLDIAFWSTVLMVRTGWFDVLNEAAFALERVENHPLPKQLHGGERGRENEDECAAG
jgi:hypothetical protein